MRVPTVGVRVEHRVSQRNAPTHAVEEYSSEKTTRRKRAECLKAIGVGNQNSHGKWQGCRVLLELKFLVGSDEEINVAAANSSNSLFLRPDHPDSAPVTTSRAANTDRRRRGSNSSRRMRLWRYGLACLLQNRNGCFAANGRKFIEKLVERLAGLKIIEQVFHRDSSASEHRYATSNLRVNVDELARHIEPPQSASQMIRRSANSGGQRTQSTSGPRAGAKRCPGTSAFNAGLGGGAAGRCDRINEEQAQSQRESQTEPHE